MDELLIAAMLSGSGITNEQLSIACIRFEKMMGTAYTERYKGNRPRSYINACIDLAKQSQK